MSARALPLVVLLATISICGCSTSDDSAYFDSMWNDESPSFSWNGRTILESKDSIDSITLVANDLERTHDERARAVYSLFALYIKPGQDASEVHRVLGDAHWLREARIEEAHPYSGMLPVGDIPNTTFYQMRLFQNEKEGRRRPWIIFFLLSGERYLLPQSLPVRNEEFASRRYDPLELVAFLKGDMSLKDSPRIVEFALCFPFQEGVAFARIERFGRRGLHVYEEVRYPD